MIGLINSQVPNIQRVRKKEKIYAHSTSRMAKVPDLPLVTLLARDHKAPAKPAAHAPSPSIVRNHLKDSIASLNPNHSRYYLTTRILSALTFYHIILRNRPERVLAKTSSPQAISPTEIAMYAINDRDKVRHAESMLNTKFPHRFQGSFQVIFLHRHALAVQEKLLVQRHADVTPCVQSLRRCTALVTVALQTR